MYTRASLAQKGGGRIPLCADSTLSERFVRRIRRWRSRSFMFQFSRVDDQDEQYVYSGTHTHTRARAHTHTHTYISYRTGETPPLVFWDFTGGGPCWRGLYVPIPSMKLNKPYQQIFTGRPTGQYAHTYIHTHTHTYTYVPCPR